MARCPNQECGGYLIYEPELAETAARVKCVVCGWMRSDPNVKERTAEVFSNGTSGQADRLATGVSWLMTISPRRAAAQLGISESFFRESGKKDLKAQVIVGGRMIAFNTPALQDWWDGKKHHSIKPVDSILSGSTRRLVYVA